MKKEIHIFAGHFGSGKTETAINFAIKKREEGKKTVIIDIDNVNPYFRTNDAAELLRDKDISLIASDFASSNIDMPVIPPEIRGVFENDYEAVIFDTGGDDDGAYAIGVYHEYFVRYGYQMHFVVNTKRPLSSTVEELLEVACRIESVSGLRFTDIYNNTNLAYITDENTLLSGIEVINGLSEKMGIPVAFHCGTATALKGLSGDMPKLEIKIAMRMPH